MIVGSVADVVARTAADNAAREFELENAKEQLAQATQERGKLVAAGAVAPPQDAKADAPAAAPADASAENKNAESKDNKDAAVKPASDPS